MIGRFFITWAFISLFIFFWVWCFPAQDKKVAKSLLKRGAIAALIALAILGVLLSLNHISGV